jgi:hypothetical protein
MAGGVVQMEALSLTKKKNPKKQAKLKNTPYSLGKRNHF